MCGILDHVDFDSIRQAEPKWFMGYSDNTNLTFLLTTLCDTASIYGPCAAAFGMEPWHESLADAYGLLTGSKQEVHGYVLWEKESLKTEENPLEPYNLTEMKVLKRFPDRDCEMEGRLLGGCRQPAAGGLQPAAGPGAGRGPSAGKLGGEGDARAPCVRTLFLRLAGKGKS